MQKIEQSVVVTDNKIFWYDTFGNWNRWNEHRCISLKLSFWHIEKNIPEAFVLIFVSVN